MGKRESLRSRLGSPPTGDSLGVVSWFQLALSELANELIDEPGLTRAQRRHELLRIVDRVAKLRDLDRIGQAERALAEAERTLGEVRRGPEVVDAGDLSESPHPIATRRGQPRRKSLR